MVARRFVVRQPPAGEEHAVEYDTEDGLDVLRFQIFSLTSVPPDLQKIVVEADGSVVDDGTDLESISDGLRLVSIDDGDDTDVAAAAAAAKAQEKSDEKFARMIQAEEEALLLQQYSIQNDGGELFRERVEPYLRQVLKYEDPMRQEAALKTVPVDELKEKALISLAKEGTFSPSKNEEDHAFLLQLLFWFKQSFRWVNAAACDSCDRETSLVGMGNPLPSEIEFGASHVEIYRCNHCSSITRFPRYNDPYKLLQTRKGRCGEWANCFTFYCRAFGYEARLILDFTDHVWTECYSNLYGRWMHLDPCEGVYDNPLLYEKGWSKKLDYAIAISKDGVRDVTKRYTRKWHEVLSRRTITSEDTVSAVLSNITNKCRSGLSTDELSAIENRDMKESDELTKATYLEVNNSISLPGRQSGSVEWRTARLELGQADSLSCSSCPVRRCVDAHVSKIYDALSAVLSHFCDTNFPNERTIQVLDTWRSLMQNLKDANFKSRRVTLDQNSNQIFEDMLPFAERLLSAISLKAELGTNGDRSVATDGNLIHASLALPVALDAVDEILSYYKSNIFYTKGHQFPRGNRLCSGSVLASCEQLPVGIATAAFDGIRLSKWEEPDGAKEFSCCAKERQWNFHADTPRVLLKLDLARAFDSLSWPFLFEVLRRYGIGNRFLDWLAILLSSASTKVMLNGEPGPPIWHRRGLRQGDPLSPQLFVLAVGTLGRLIKWAIDLGVLQLLHPRHQIPSISLYADDVILFCHLTEGDITAIKEILSLFSRVSGLHVNFAKSSATLIRGVAEEAAPTLLPLGCAMVDFPFTYLGIPLSIRKLTSAQMQPLVEKLAAKLPTWKLRLMQKPGRLALVKSVLGAIPIHQMLVLSLSKKTIKAMERIERGFLWEGRASANGGSCHVNWRRICRPIGLGGLGIQDLELTGMTLRLRWLWLDRTDPNRAWQGLTPQFSEIERNLFFASTYMVLGNGETAKFWEDRWIQGHSISKLAPHLYACIPKHRRKSRTVADGLQANRWAQDIQGVVGIQEIGQYLQLWQLITPTILSSEADRLVWKWTSNGEYSAKSAYLACFHGSTKCAASKLIWKSWAPNRVKFFSWLANLDRC